MLENHARITMILVLVDIELTLTNTGEVTDFFFNHVGVVSVIKVELVLLYLCQQILYCCFKSPAQMCCD